MIQTAYIETSVISYLTGRTSRDLVVAAHQQITNDWWEKRRSFYELYISEFVSLEASKGDKDAAEKRMSVVNTLTYLEVTDTVKRLATFILQKGLLPREAVEDAFHIAVATVHKMDFLITWNCKHIANAEIHKKLSKAVALLGFELPTICTPEELLGE